MNVLSLFDGMSCGRIALERAGIGVTNYFASEIDKHAIVVAQANYPDTVQLGDINKLSASYLSPIDLILGGSPCQGFSSAGKRGGFNDSRSALFFEYVRMFGEIMSYNPNIKFILENVKMKKEDLNIISMMLGVGPIYINSALVSAQNRQRCYWTNLPGLCQPDDKNIRLADIIQSEKDVPKNMYYGDKSIGYMMRGNDKWQQAGACRMDRYLQTANKEKSFTLTANMHKGAPYNFCNFATGEPHYRKLTPIERERLQTVPDNYTNHVSNTQRYKMLGNGWTVDVIAHILRGLKR